MSKIQEQKLKILYVKDFIENYSSKEKPVNANDIIAYLESKGISAERKSIYDDINGLISYGLDIVKVPGRNGGYYISTRDFSAEKIKLLLDNLSSSKYISKRTIDNISNDLKQLLPQADKDEIKHEIYVRNRVRNTDFLLFEHIATIDKAIKAKYLLKFQYTEWQITDDSSFINYEKVKHKDGKVYTVHPLQMIYAQENYYLVAIDLYSYETKHFRIDKIINLEIHPERDLKAMKRARRFDPSKYSKSLFDMFNGEEVACELVFRKDLIAVLLERFGENMMILKSEEAGYYKTVQIIKLSSNFLAWVLSFDGKIKIKGSDKVVAAMQDFIKASAKDYISED